MLTLQTILKKTPSDWEGQLAALATQQPTLVLVFGAPAFFRNPAFGATLTRAFPGAAIAGCSTAGEISTAGTQEGSCIVTALRFDHAAVSAVATDLADMADSRAAGRRLAALLGGNGLRAVMVFGQGVRINGSALVDGMADILGGDIPITGGLAGDEGAFSRTWTLGPGGVSERAIVALGFRGERLEFGHGSFGGWAPFGPARRVTRCDGNILHELDGESALAIYRRYLGDFAEGLPASGLLFPFAILGEDQAVTGLIRTILGIDEASGSLILAGEIEPGGYLRLMHASIDSLVNGAETAAESVRRMCGEASAGLAILISCIGRKLVMGDRTDDEVEAVASVLGRGATLTGFYSNGEISPLLPGVGCKLHNQTMTITWLSER